MKYARKCQKFQQLFLSFFCFVKFKISSFPQKELYNHKMYRQCTLGSKQQICRRICDKNQYLLIFDNFWKNLWFSVKFSFFEAHFWNFKIVGNEQTQKKYFHLIEKFMEIKFHILNNAPYWEMDALFIVKGVSLWGTQRETVLPQIY